MRRKNLRSICCVGGAEANSLILNMICRRQPCFIMEWNGANGTWVTVCCQGMGYSFRRRAAGFLLPGNVWSCRSSTPIYWLPGHRTTPASGSRLPAVAQPPSSPTLHWSLHIGRGSVYTRLFASVFAQSQPDRRTALRRISDAASIGRGRLVSAWPRLHVVAQR